ncbi:cyclin-related protein FAM58A-like [Acanthaster planci]|uniref:Cyclin-Q n=1 Tax=Acanthaster planci TaxID=133434 RepID=A0A8B7ZY88_ACAPL|nr:cyclin-related protein FAM58A-like [Acanthaster planci]XP_022110057.1 cyclin-related protein FAM58A-like [Acanthaster planci]XP_022110058.1 cyclin-related protein FAM58A-like [Acanthaster planci]
MPSSLLMATVTMATTSSSEVSPSDPAIAKAHFRVAQYMMEAGIKLHLQSVTVASACTMYYRFFSVCDVRNYDAYLVGAAAIYLATKVEEQHVKLRDIINVCYRILHREEAPLEVGKKYWDLRESVINCELLLIRMLKFNPKVTLPHKYMVHYLKSLQDWMDQNMWSKTPICRMAWAMLGDCYHGSICIRVKPQHLAVAVIYFAMQCYGVNMPHQEDQAKKKWWQVFSEELNEEKVQEIVAELIDMYEMETKV